MKSLLKLNLILLLAFFANNILNAQCANMYPSVTKVSEDATSVTYRFTVNTNTKADEIKLYGYKTCYNTNYCSSTKRISKTCKQRHSLLGCESKKDGCKKQDGCVVVIDPLSNCGGNY